MLGLIFVLAGFAGLAGTIAWIGIRIAKLGDRLADRTGWGEAIMGAVFIGATTSLPGSVASILAAAANHPSLAISNGIGGIAAQTAFLAIADITYRRANLEHAAAAPENLTQCALLVVMLGIVILAVAAPPVAVFGINPASLVLLAAYGFGVHLITRARNAPMWQPERTADTITDTPADTSRDMVPLSRLWLRFAVLAVLLAASGFGIAQAAFAIVEMTPLSESVIGALLVAIATSLPELVIALGAVRQGALTLAVGNILGGNCFDVLFLSMSDVAYRPGSIYHAAAAPDRLIIALALLMAGILLLGLLRRQKHGIANIGFESMALLGVYLLGMAVVAAM